MQEPILLLFLFSFRPVPGFPARMASGNVRLLDCFSLESFVPLCFCISFSVCCFLCLLFLPGLRVFLSAQFLEFFWDMLFLFLQNGFVGFDVHSPLHFWASCLGLEIIFFLVRSCFSISYFLFLG